MNETKPSFITGFNSTAYNSGSNPCYTDPACGDYGVSQSAIYALNADEQKKKKIGNLLLKEIKRKISTR